MRRTTIFTTCLRQDEIIFSTEGRSPISPGRVVNQGLRLVFGELLGLELVDGGYSRPVVFCGRACGGTFIRPSYSQALPQQLWALLFFFHNARGLQG